MSDKTHVPITETHTPEEVEYFAMEAAEDLEIAPEELVRQAAAFYCKEMRGGRHE